MTDYLIEYALHGSGTWTVFPHPTASIDTVITITGLSPGVSYDVQVASLNEQGQSAFSPVATASPIQVPGQPLSLAVGTIGSGSVQLSWNPPIDGGPIATYTVQYRVTGTGNWLTAKSGITTTSTTVTSLAFSTGYDFQVLGLNSSGTGAPSAGVSATTQAYTKVSPALSAGSYIMAYEYPSGSGLDQRGSTTEQLFGSAAIVPNGIGSTTTLNTNGNTNDYATYSGGAIASSLGGSHAGTVTCFWAGELYNALRGGGAFNLAAGATSSNNAAGVQIGYVPGSGWFSRWANNSGTRTAAFQTSPAPVINTPVLLTAKFTNDGTNLTNSIAVNGGTAVAYSGANVASSSVAASFDFFELNWLNVPGSTVQAGFEQTAFVSCVTGEAAADDTAIQNAYMNALGIAHN